MALEGGSAVKGTGLAGAIAAARKKAAPSYDPRKDKAIDLEAAAIIEYIVSNTEINTTVSTTVSTVVVTDPVTGAGTGTGTGSGSGTGTLI